MASSEVPLEDVYYREMTRIQNSEWFEFARRLLRIPEHKIDDIRNDFDKDIREQKFQMLRFWGSTRLNDEGSESLSNRLQTLITKYLSSSKCNSGNECDGAEICESDGETLGNLIFIYDSKLEPQISKTKDSFEKDNYRVEALVCSGDKRPRGNSLDIVAASSYRVFVLTGAFMSLSFDYFTNTLQKSTCKNTLLLTKTIKELPERCDHLQLTTLNRLAADDMYHAIKAFLSDQYRSPKACHDDVDEDLDDTPNDEQYQRHSDILNDKGFPDPHETKFANVLIIGRIGRRIPQLSSLAEIPWLKVFDFDPKSRAFGVLSHVEPRLRSLRPLTISDAKDCSVESLNDCTTNWVFINGYCDSEFKKFVECPELDDSVISKHCDSLINYCVGRRVLKLVVIWESCTYDERLDSFMSNVKYHLKSNKFNFRCIICTPTKPYKRSELGMMCKRLRLDDFLCLVPVLSVCKWIKVQKKHDLSKYGNKTLPQFSSDGLKDTCALSQKDFNWLSVCFDVVGSNESEVPDEDLSRSGQDFLKGRKAEWRIIASKKYVSKRDILPDQAKFVRKQYIKTGKSGIVTIFHAPGGGGTTFSRRLLWELRADAPCLELRSMDISIEDVKQRLSFIRNETHLPAVVLVDGCSHLDVKTLLETCRYEKVVILHVQRFYSSATKLPKKKTTDYIWVPENVSKTEANTLLEIFSSVRPEQKRALSTLTDDVDRGTDHCMFEYGLTAYDSEYHGVKSYVHGNLQISKSTELENWHKALTYLSLAQYYGHCALPAQLFSHLLGKDELDIVTLEDLPHQARKFVIEDSTNYWKISYYIVAKEILEQVLVKRPQPEYCNQGKCLTKEARENLCNTVVRFIFFVKSKMSSMPAKQIPSHIHDILTAILIKRNYKDAGENDEFGNRSKYSRILDDVSLDDNRKQILKTLAEEFPSNAEFHAHLGRFYGKNKYFQEAEKCFQNAFNVRKEEKCEKEGREGRPMNYPGDPVLHRIHSMYAFYLSEQIRHEMSKYEGVSQKRQTQIILDKARLAVKHFQLSKDCYQKGCNPGYVYIGEIKLRLMIAGYANKISSGNIANLHDDDVPYRSLGDFVFESFSYCDQLLVQCLQFAEEYKMPQDELDACINNFNTFFKSSEMALKHWMGRDQTLYSKKCHVAVLKMEMMKKVGNPHKFCIYQDVTNTERLFQLVELYEGILADARKMVAKSHYISNYMIEWLQAIRHPSFVERKDYYQLKQVHSRVEEWDEKNERGSLSTFYNYVLTTLLAINGVRGELTNTYSEKSNNLRERTKDLLIPLPVMERTAEWLADVENSQSIQNLIHRSLMGEWDGKFFKKEKASKLKVCKGKISTCHIWYGHIVLDGGHRPEITVFFNPQRYGFGGSDSRQKIRVEFYLGFNPRHGAEAFQVRVLERYECCHCRTYTEIPKLGRIESKWYANCPKCDKAVDARTCKLVKMGER